MECVMRMIALFVCVCGVMGVSGMKRNRIDFSDIIRMDGSRRVLSLPLLQESRFPLESFSEKTNKMLENLLDDIAIKRFMAEEEQDVEEDSNECEEDGIRRELRMTVEQSRGVLGRTSYYQSRGIGPIAGGLSPNTMRPGGATYKQGGLNRPYLNRFTGYTGRYGGRHIARF